NVIFYPMLFLSGVFFPISDMPAFLQVVSEFLPLTYFIKALDNLILFDNIQAVVLPITIMAVIAVLLFFAASYIATNRERL
ncbi:MAG: ABC transporter permease, partial [Candidatus Thermoplasmatota archaeon]|nr:ABC transporter permease [Candidatus Thermoplasmatota archaeon]